MAASEHRAAIVNRMKFLPWVIAILIVYAPHSWIFFGPETWSERVQWLKLWPVLPGLIALTLTDDLLIGRWYVHLMSWWPGGAPVRSFRLRDVLSRPWIEFLIVVASLAHVLAAWWLFRRVTRARVIPIALLALYSTALGVVSYLFSKA